MTKDDPDYLDPITIAMCAGAFGMLAAIAYGALVVAMGGTP